MTQILKLKGAKVISILNVTQSISLKYNQQDATFARPIYFYKLLHMFQAFPPPIIRSTKLYIQRQLLSHYERCILLVVLSRYHFSCSGEDLTREAYTASGIVKPILLPVAIVDEMELKFHLIHDSSRQNYWFDNTDAVCTVLCS